MQPKSVFRALACGAALLWAAAGRAQQVSGSVEGGLQSLAQEIVAKSATADRDVIAVLPFPNADGTCSVLSTYLVDELIQALFSVPGSPLKIVERSQLEALIREIQIGEGGLLNPETTQKLGNVSGVKALAVGTITEIGDRIRINARLVATDTGRTVSAAAVTVPRTGDVDGLLRRPIPSAQGICGAVERGARPTATPAMAGGTFAGTSPARSGAVATATMNGLTFAVQSISRSNDKKLVSIILSVVNTTQQPLRTLLLGPKPTIIDDNANLADTTEVTGIRNCDPDRRPFWQDANWCATSQVRTSWTTLSPNFPVTVLFRFKLDEPITGNTLSFTSNMFVEEATEGDKPAPGKVHQVSLSLSNLQIGGPK